MGKPDKMRVVTHPERNILRIAGITLDGWQERAWTVQGFGMVRTYLDDAKEWRLNIWDASLKVPNVSEIHDHPWSFTSWVLCGGLTNIRFERADQVQLVQVPGDARRGFSLKLQHVVIATGEGGGPICAPDTVELLARQPESYGPGEGYIQERAEVHQTIALPGTVTLNQRSPATPEHTANIYWPSGPWVSAEPRPATRTEIYNAVRLAQRQAELLRRVAL